jgi:hypothetical protein
MVLLKNGKIPCGYEEDMQEMKDIKNFLDLCVFIVEVTSVSASVNLLTFIDFSMKLSLMTMCTEIFAQLLCMTQTSEAKAIY